MKSNDLSKILVEASKETSSAKDKLKTALDVYNAGSNYIKDIYAVRTTKNIGKDSLLQFPLLMDTSIGEEAIITLNKALEHEYINYILIALNEILVLNVHQGDTTGDILKKVHTNIDSIDDGVNQVVNDMRSFLSEGLQIKDIALKLENRSIKEIERLNEEYLLTPISESLNEKILNHYSMSKRILDEATSTRDKINGNNTRGKDISAGGKEVDDEIGRSTMEIIKIDYNKINALAPTIVKCTVTFQVGGSNGKIIKKDIIFGVKTVVHPISTENMIKYLSEPIKYGKNGKDSFLLKTIKFLSGEMKARDFFLNASSAKRRALDLHQKDDGGNGYWFERLRDMASNNKLQRAIPKSGGNSKKPTYMTAVTTVVISKSAAERIKNITGNNIMNNPNYINSIMKEFFLMNFVIVDEPSSLVYVFDDCKNSYQAFSLNGLKAIAKSEIMSSQGIFK